MTNGEQLNEFRRHAVWESADALVEFSRAARPRSEDDRATLARVASIAAWVKGFRSTPPLLFPSNRIEYAQRLLIVLNNLMSQVAGWNQDAAILPQTVASIDSLCDEVIGILGESRWPLLRQSKGSRDLTDVVDNYVSVTEASLLSVNSRLAEADARLSTIQQQASATNESAGDALTAAERSRDDIEKQQAALEQTATQNLAALLASLQKDSDARLRDLEKQTIKERDALLKEAENLLDGLRANHETGNELVKQVADQSVGGGYLDLAAKEQRAYRMWNGVGIGAVAIAFVYLALVFWVQAPRDVEGAILKLGISLTLVLFSAYAFREAGKRLRQSIDARYRALDVIALPPFSNDLDETQRQQLRYLMGHRLFASSSAEAQGSARKAGKESSYSLNLDPSFVKIAMELIQAAQSKP